MKPVLYYLVQVICTSAILYGYYHIALRNKKFHRYNRFYLLASAVISIFIPFLNIPVYFTHTETETSFVLQTLTVISSSGGDEAINPAVASTHATGWFTTQNVLYTIYILAGTVLLFRILLSLARIRRIIRTNPVERVDKIRFVNTEEPGTPFSFFRWMFWNKNINLRSSRGEQIFRHELFHIEQRHSRDVIFMELVTVIFWINPFFHLIKKELKAIHEFLADRFAIREHNSWEYAELLLMQAFQTHQSLVNPFFHNQIKRRIAMITTSQKPGHQYLRKMMVLPLAAVAVALFAFNYRSKKENYSFPPNEKPLTVVIDAGHGGTDAGAIAGDGTPEKDIALAIAQKVKKLNEDEHIRIILTREGDENSTLASRVELTAKNKADLFLSLHINTSGDQQKDKTGVEVVISRKNKTHEPENKILATILLNYFTQLFSTRMDIVQRNEGIYVLDNAPCPSALIECGFISNAKDLAYIKDAASQEKIATVILNAIDQYATQRKSADWDERKQIMSDTTEPEVRLLTNTATGEKYLAVDNKKITGIIHTKQNDHIGLVTDGGVTVLSKERSNEVRAKYGEWLKKLKTAGEIVTQKETTKVGPDNIIFDKVETEAAFPGGDAAWRKYLERNLDASVAIKQKAPDGAYTVVVLFIVDKEGNISDVKALTKHGFGMETEAVKVIRQGPKWTPGMQNGRIVKTYKKQPVTFIVGKGEKNFKPGTQVTNGAMNEVVVMGF